MRVSWTNTSNRIMKVLWKSLQKYQKDEKTLHVKSCGFTVNFNLGTSWTLVELIHHAERCHERMFEVQSRQFVTNMNVGVEKNDVPTHLWSNDKILLVIKTGPTNRWESTSKKEAELS